MDSESAARVDAAVLERYKFLNTQITASNEATFRHLALFQTLTSAIVTAGLALFVGYKKWGVTPHIAHQALIGLLTLETIVAVFTSLFLLAGVASWLDYRREECRLLNGYLGQQFREAPQTKNFYRWIETYIIGLVAVTAIILWILATAFLIPAMT